MTDEKRCIRSQYKCGHCGDIVASFHRHDFRTCRCGALSVDGGLDYTRIVLGKSATFEDAKFCSIVVPDCNDDDAKLILGVLCALEFLRPTPLYVLEAAMVVQHSKKPWFPAPGLKHDLLRALGVLEDAGYIEGDRGSPVDLYQRVVELAPWPSDEDWL